MSFFDSFDWGDPSTMAALGAIQGLGAAGMPSRMPVPMGAALAQAAGGMAQGAQQAQQYAKGQLGLKSDQLNYRMKNDFLGPMLSQLESQQQAGSPTPSSPNPDASPSQNTPSSAPSGNQSTGPTKPAGMFDDYYSKFLAPHEGGYNANDGNGNPVNYGINQGANPDVNVKNLTPDQAKQLTYSRYWKVSGADSMNPALAAIQADTAFNFGVTPAFQMLQQSGGDPQKYLALRAQRYQQIASGDPAKAKNLPAWLQRNSDLGQYVSGFTPQDGNPQPSPQQANAQPQGNGQQNSSGPANGTGIGNSLAMRMLFGGQPRYQTMRNGWAYDNWTNSWNHFPNLGEGVTGEAGPDGKITASVVPGELSALGDVEYKKSGAQAAGAYPYEVGKIGVGGIVKKNVEGYGTYLETGGLGMTGPTGDLKPNAGIPAPPSAPGNSTGITQNGTTPVGAAVPPAQPVPTTQPIKTAQGTILPPLSDAAPINQGSEYLSKRIPQWAQTEDEWNDALPSGYIGEQRALAIADALKQVQSGAYTTDLAGFAAKLKALNINMPITALQRDPASVEEALKNNFQTSIQAIRAFSARPAAVELLQYSKNFANPDLRPEANLQIIGETVGTLRWERALVNDWAQAKQEGWQDPQDFQRVWTKENPIQGFINDTEKQIGPLKGMPGFEQNQAVQKMITPDAIAYTAKKYGHTVDQVKANLRAQGYQVQ